MIEFGCPVAPPMIEFGCPVAPPMIEFGCPVAPPMIEFGCPVYAVSWRATGLPGSHSPTTFLWRLLKTRQGPGFHSR